MGTSGLVEEVPFWAPFLAMHRRALQVGAHHLRAAGVVPPVGGGYSYRWPSAGPPVMSCRQGRDRSRPGRARSPRCAGAPESGVAEILSHTAVEVDVHQTGDHVTAGRVRVSPPRALEISAPSVQTSGQGRPVPGQKTLARGYPHTHTPASISLLRAGLSPTSTHVVVELEK